MSDTLTFQTLSERRVASLSRSTNARHLGVFKTLNSYNRLLTVRYVHGLLSGWYSARGVTSKFLERLFLFLMKDTVGIMEASRLKMYQIVIPMSGIIIWGYRYAKRNFRQGALKKLLTVQLDEATTYEAWVVPARELDRVECNPKMKLNQEESRIMRSVSQRLRQLRNKDHVHGLAWVLRQELSSKRVGKSMAFASGTYRSHCVDPPEEVVEYIEEMKKALSHICRHKEVPLHEKSDFFRVCRHSYGRTAIALSGGGSFGHFHFGVCHALLCAGLLPDILSGSSAGSIGCAMLCTRTNKELEDAIDMWIDCPDNDFYGAPKTARDMIASLFRQGSLHNADEYVVRLKRLFGNLTFREAFQRTGRVLCVSISPARTHEPPRLCNYLTTPDVLIWSAIACSSAFPFLFNPQQLYSKDAKGGIVPHHTASKVARNLDDGDFGIVRLWQDGSLQEDLPLQSLREQFNVNYFLVSQCNPYLVPIMGVKKMIPSVLWYLFETETKHRLGQLLTFFPRSKFLKLICQPWEGDLNFVLPYTSFNVLRSAVNFSPKEIKQAMREGQYAVWRILGIVKASFEIESCILDQLKIIIEEEKGKSLENKAFVKTKSSIPSWLDLQTIIPEPVAKHSDVVQGTDLRLHSSSATHRSHNLSLTSIDSSNHIIEEDKEMETGIEAWRDIAALTMSLDVVAP